jgi:hypothetical protein
MSWKHHAVALVVALTACTAPNPNYVAGGGPDDGSANDFAVDMKPADLSGNDLAPVCTVGQRTCLAQSGSAACEGGQYHLDRKCPTASVCATGYCQPPPASTTSMQGQPCDATGGALENDCFSGVSAELSCQPFVASTTPKKVTWVCDAPVGAGVPGTACTTGDECRSGFCGSNGTCFRACAVTSDCPIQGNTGQTYPCMDVTIVVEGEMVTAKSCVP